MKNLVVRFVTLLLTSYEVIGELYIHIFKKTFFQLTFFSANYITPGIFQQP